MKAKEMRETSIYSLVRNDVTIKDDISGEDLGLDQDQSIHDYLRISQTYDGCDIAERERSDNRCFKPEWFGIRDENHYYCTDLYGRFVGSDKWTHERFDLKLIDVDQNLYLRISDHLVKAADVMREVYKDIFKTKERYCIYRDGDYHHLAADNLLFVSHHNYLTYQEAVRVLKKQGLVTLEMSDDGYKRHRFSNCQSMVKFFAENSQANVCVKSTGKRGRNASFCLYGWNIV